MTAYLKMVCNMGHNPAAELSMEITSEETKMMAFRGTQLI
jgi:hypothetical protein